jgi:hypothetical protein
VAVLAGLALAIRAVLQAGRERERSGPLLFILAWALIPTVLTLVAYAGGEPIELSRVTILELPALALLVAWLLLRPQVMPVLGGAAVAVLLVLRLLQVIPAYGVSPEPWNAVTTYVLKATPSTRPACVAFYAQDGREAFDYYLKEWRPSQADPAPSLRPVLPSLPWHAIRSYVERYSTLDSAQQPRIAAQCPRLWLVSSHSGQANGTRQSLVNLQRYNTLVQTLTRRYPHTSLRTFGWASPINVRLYWR